MKKKILKSFIKWCNKKSFDRDRDYFNKKGFF
jgi:hypothetical protein